MQSVSPAPFQRSVLEESLERSLQARYPITWTQRHACPPDCRWQAGPGFVAWRSRCVSAHHAFRLELEVPAARPVDAFALWDEIQGQTAVQRRVLQWETGLEVPFPAISPRYAPTFMLGLRSERAPAQARAPLPVREAEKDSLEAVSQAAAREHPERGEDYLEEMRWLYLGLAARGATTLAAWEGERPVAALTLVALPGGSRLQHLWTARTHRRQGLARALLTRAMQRSAGPCWLVTEEGSAAHALYQTLGFAPVSRVVLLSTERP